MLPTTEALLPTAPPAQAGDKPLTRYAARFHMLAIFSTLSLLNGFLWIGFAPIEPLARSYFGVGTWAINLLSAIFMVLYAPGSLLGAYLMQRHGLRLSLVVGAALQCFGGWLRYLGTVLLHDWGFTVLLLGQGLAGLAQPVFTNAPAKLAGEWFPSSERELATVVGALSNVVGNAVGQVVPSVMVTCDASPSADNTTRACSEPAQITGMASLALLQAGLGTAALLWAALCLRAEPPTPPTRSAQERRAARAQLSCAASTPRLRRRASLREVRANTALLLRDAQFLLILAGFGVGLGLFNGLLTDLGQLIQPLYCRYTATASTAAANTAAAATAATDAAAAAAATGASAPPPYTCDIAASSRDAGLYGGVMIGAGLLGAAAVGAALDATHRYKTFLKGGFVAAVGGIGFCMAQLRPANSAVLAAAFGVMGLCTMPLLPVALECAVECTYPVPELLSTSAAPRLHLACISPDLA